MNVRMEKLKSIVGNIKNIESDILNNVISEIYKIAEEYLEKNNVSNHVTITCSHINEIVKSRGYILKDYNKLKKMLEKEGFDVYLRKNCMCPTKDNCVCETIEIYLTISIEEFQIDKCSLRALNCA